VAVEKLFLAKFAKMKLRQDAYSIPSETGLLIRNLFATS